jgi:CheY-like chemotaxis protein
MALVLVIDDEEDALRVVEVMLKNAGHDAVLAVDGNDALRQFRRQHVFMPNKEGIETLKELRELDPTVPIIMMSGDAPTAYFWGATYRDYLAMVKEFGATRTIEQPFKYSQLIRLVQECLAGCGTATAAARAGNIIDQGGVDSLRRVHWPPSGRRPPQPPYLRMSAPRRPTFSLPPPAVPSMASNTSGAIFSPRRASRWMERSDLPVLAAVSAANAGVSFNSPS